MADFDEIFGNLGGEGFEGLLQVHDGVVVPVTERAHIFQGLVGLVEHLPGILVLARLLDDLDQLIQLLGDADGEQIVQALQPTDTDALVQDVDRLQVHQLLARLEIEEAVGSQDEGCFPGVRQLQQLSEHPPQECIALGVLEVGDRDVLVVVELLKAGILDDERILLHIHITVNQFLKLLEVHF